MQQGDSIVGEQVTDLLEEGPVLGPADVLEHADRADPVITAGLVSVVAQVELCAVAEPSRPRALPSDLELLLGQGNAGALAVGRSGEPAPQDAHSPAHFEPLPARPLPELAAEIPPQ